MFDLGAYDRSRNLAKKPAWLALYAIAATLIGAMGLLERYVPPGPARTVRECAVVLLGFGLMLFWRHCNRARWL